MPRGLPRGSLLKRDWQRIRKITDMESCRFFEGMVGESKAAGLAAEGPTPGLYVEHRTLNVQHRSKDLRCSMFDVQSYFPPPELPHQPFEYQLFVHQTVFKKLTRPHSKSLSSGRFQVFRHRRTSLWLAGVGFQAADAADEQVLSGHRRGLLHNTHICRCLEAYSSRGAFFSELQSGQIQAACSSSSRRRFFISMMRQQL